MADEITREPLAEDLSDAEIEQLTALRLAAGASGCEVQEDQGQRFLVCRWPPVG